MDRLITIVLWVIILAFIIGVLRYYQGALALAQTFFGWVFGESELLSGMNPGAGRGSGSGVQNYPSYQAA